jgi:hypothetical protein
MKEFNLPMCITITDYTKAFDRVPQGRLWNIIKTSRFLDHTVKTVHSLNINTRINTDRKTLVGNKET